MAEIAFKRTLKGEHLFQIVQLLMKYGKTKHVDAKEKLGGAIKGLQSEFVKNWGEDPLALVVHLFGDSP